MRRTMVGVAPAANTPQAFDGARTLATNLDAASGHESADTAVALPPEMVKALGERTMLSAQEPEHAAAPMTMRMSEAPPKAPIPLPSGAPGSPIAAKGPRSAPSIAPSAPRGSPSVPPPRLASSVGLGGAGREGATTPATDPVAAPLPLKRRPLVTTYALSPIAVAPLEAPVAAAALAMPVEAPPPGSRSGEPTRVAAVIEPDVSGVVVVAPVVAAPVAISPVRTIGPGQRASAMPPPHASVPPAAGTIKGMPLVSASAPPQGSLAPQFSPAPGVAALAPEAASPLPASRLMVGDGTMVLAPTNAPLAPTVSMPPMPPAMPAGMSQVSQSSRAAIPAAPPRTAPLQPGPSKLSSSPQHLAQHAAPQQHAPMPPLQRPPPALSPAPFVAAPVAWSPQGPPPLPSHPSLAETRSPSDEQPAALTYQVYNPALSPAGRGPALSRVSFPEPGVPKASVGLRVCLVLLGVCVVVGTAGAIILSGADDPTKAATANAPSASVSVAPTPPPPSPPPPAPPVVIGDPVPAPVVPPIGTTSAKPAASGKPKPTGSAALKGAKIPPNPFGGGGTLPAKRK